MQFRVIDADEAERFDEFMQSTPNGHIFQSYLWGEVKKPVWEPIRVILEEDSRIVAAASILKRRIPLLRKTFFYLPRGPVLLDWYDRQAFDQLIVCLRTLARQHRAVFIKIDPCLSDLHYDAVALLRQTGFITPLGKHEFGGLQPRYTFCLDISGDKEDIMSGFSKKTRYKIRYGLSKGIRFESPGEKGLELFLKVMRETGRRGDFVVRNLSYYQKVYRTLAARDAVNLTIGYLNGEPVTAGITFAFGDKAWAVYGGQSDRFRNVYAYHAMIWERIKWAKDRGARWFDFYGVPGEVSEDHPLYGIYHFKKSFGGDYFAFIGEKDLILSPVYYWLWIHLFPAARNILLQIIKLRRFLIPSWIGRGKAVTRL
ncbi:MAG: peptidoglycan bridge formation glycyltransferase FemA/FemB family protein [Dethiobacter sp.]|nr:peptidoglycan bridge formation glycyltransferase FemA/FemB family protein [Dethiobacter sp.]